MTQLELTRADVFMWSQNSAVIQCKVGMGIFQKYCIRIFGLIKKEYSNICLFKGDIS